MSNKPKTETSGAGPTEASARPSPPAAPAGLRGVTSSANRKAVHGLDGPPQGPQTSRDRLCQALNLHGTISDAKLYDEAAAVIEKLRTPTVA